jgi:putative membrane protein
LQNRSLLTEQSLDRIEAAVAEAEAHTSCEYIVVLAPASDRYEGRALKAGAAAAVIMFVALYWLNEWLYGMPLDPLLLLVEASALGAAVSLLCARLNPLRRLLIPRWRMAAAVDSTAHSVFSEENVSLTRDRNAVLLYISVLEGELRLMPDIGVQQKVHDARLGEIESHLANAGQGDPTELVINALQELAQCCKECFPIREDDENELPDRPQIRLP